MGRPQLFASQQLYAFETVGMVYEMSKVEKVTVKVEHEVDGETVVTEIEFPAGSYLMLSTANLIGMEDKHARGVSNPYAEPPAAPKAKAAKRG